MLPVGMGHCVPIGHTWWSHRAPNGKRQRLAIGQMGIGPGGGGRCPPSMCREILMMLVTQNLCSYKAVTASRNVLTVSQGRLAVMGWKVMTGVATVVGLLLGLGTLASAVATNWATARIYALPITGGVFYVLLASISVWDYRHRQAPWTTEGLVNWPVPLVILGGLLGVALDRKSVV